MQTKFSKKAQNLLLHPLTLGTILLYFINNHILQIKHPSWLTGKISGFAWLFFIPYVALFIFSIIFPKKVTKHKYFDLSIFFFIGASFSFIKIIAGANQAVSSFLQNALGLRIQIIQDPSDLLALLALIGSFYFWRKFQTINQKISFSKSLIILGLASLFTLADAAMEDYGITHLETLDSATIASSTYFTFISYDGGFTWEKRGDSTEFQILETRNFASSERGLLQVRFDEAKKIEISSDGGGIWQTEYQLEQITESQRAYYLKTHTGNPFFEPGPFDFLIDPVTQNIIFAMGHEGILIRTPNAQWVWVTVDEYKRVTPSSFNLYLSLLGGEGLLGLASGILVFSTIGLRLFKKNKLWVFIISLGWIVFLISLWINQPALTSNGYESTISGAILAATLIIPLIIGINQFGLAVQNGKTVKLSIYGCTAIFLFMLSYILWASNTVASYSVASFFAIICQVIILSIGLYKTSPMKEDTEMDK